MSSASRAGLAVVDDDDAEAEHVAHRRERQPDVPATDDDQLAGRLVHLDHDARVAGARLRAPRHGVAFSCHVDGLGLQARALLERSDSGLAHGLLDGAAPDAADGRPVLAHEHLSAEEDALVLLLAEVDDGRHGDGLTPGERLFNDLDDLCPHIAHGVVAPRPPARLRLRIMPRPCAERRIAEAAAQLRFAPSPPCAAE